MRVCLRDLHRGASPARHATGGMKGMPHHEVGERPVPAVQTREGGPRIWFEKGITFLFLIIFEQHSS